MAYLPNKSKRVGYELVGASMPLQVSNYLKLYALAKGKSKSAVIGGLLIAWIEACHVAQQGEDFLITLIVDRIYKDWTDRKAKYPSIKFGDYIAGVTRELTKKGLPEDTITQIRLIVIKEINGTNKKVSTVVRTDNKKGSKSVKRKG